MLHSSNLRKLLQQTLEPIQTPVSRYQLQSAVLLSRKTGSIVSFASIENTQPTNRDTINNLKMMALFIKEKWAEDEQDPEAQSTKSCYHVTLRPSSSTPNQQPAWTSRIYTCGLEDLHTCMAQIPGSDILLLFIGDSSFPHGLLVMKMKSVLSAFTDIYGYKLD